MKTSSKSLGSDLRSTGQSLEAWRRARKPGEAIPEALWNQMVQLARVHGPSRVSRVLRVGFEGLARRLKEPPPPEPAPAPPKPPAFVELPWPPAPAVPNGVSSCVAELEDGSGSKLTLRFAHPSPQNALALAEAFWRRRP
jgi:hypothetical protein